MKKSIWNPHAGAQTEFFRRLEDVVGYGGAKGGGKTDALLFDALRQIAKPRYKALLLRRTYPQLQEMIDRAHQYYPSLGGKWKGDLHRYTFASGAFVDFGHCENEIDKERYQGKEYHYIGFDQLEQFLESQFTFICAQNRTSDPDIQCFIRCTFNPGSVGHWWVKKRFIDEKKPLQTYSEMYEVYGKKISRTFCFVPSSVRDNPTLLSSNPTYLANLMSLPENEKKAYLEGDWNVFTTECVFGRDGMGNQETTVVAPQWIGYLKDYGDRVAIVPDEKGPLKIYQEYRSAYKYIIGADVAEGVADGDYSSAHVLNLETWEVVAHWHGHMSPGDFGEALANLGFYYDNAIIACEVNNHGIGTVQKLTDLQYKNLYFHEEGKPGWNTNSKTRPLMISSLIQAVSESSVKVRDRGTLDEMYNFIRNEKDGKIEAREGTHDDRVISLCISAHCARYKGFQSGFKERPSQNVRPYIPERFRRRVA